MRRRFARIDDRDGRADVAVPSAGQGLDPAYVACFAQHPPQGGDLDAEIAFFDRKPWPCSFDQCFSGYWLARSFEQQPKQGDRTAAKRDGFPAPQERFRLCVDPEKRGSLRLPHSLSGDHSKRFCNFFRSISGRRRRGLIMLCPAARGDHDAT